MDHHGAVWDCQERGGGCSGSSGLNNLIICLVFKAKECLMFVPKSEQSIFNIRHLLSIVSDMSLTRK